MAGDIAVGGSPTVSDQGFDGLADRITVRSDTLTELDAAHDFVRLAEQRAITAGEDLDKYRAELLDRIHNSVTPGTDPGAYLKAALNAAGPGHTGTIAVGTLEPLREQIRRGPIPIAVVGSWAGRVIFGLSAGDIIVRQPTDEESPGSFEVNPVGLWLPLSNVSAMHRPSTDRYNGGWDYIGDFAAGYQAGVWQDLNQLQLTDNPQDVKQRGQKNQV